MYIKCLLREILIIFLLLSNIIFEKKANLRERKVLFFGAPIISLKYMTQACKLISSSSTSFVKQIYSINNGSDFDIVSNNIFRFLSEIKKHNIYLNYYNSIDIFFGPISRHLFVLYKKIKNKKIVVMHYGSDAWMYSRIPDYLLRHALNIEYYNAGINEDKIQKRYFWVNKVADVRLPAIMSAMVLSTWDVLPVHYYPVDIEKISKIKNDKYETFTIIHSPNHRGVKGTEFLIEAVKQLQEEGYQIQLKLLEKVKNDKVLIELSKSHLLVEQLIMGYALSAMEGMACGLPVISNLEHHHYDLFRKYSYLSECPIISCGLEIKDIKEKILYAMENQEELSIKSLEYVKKYHSYEANAVFWNKVFESLETGERPINYFHPIIGDYYKDYEKYIEKSK